MQNQVEVLADDMGNVVRLSKNNPEYSFIRLGYKSVSIGKGGWLRERNLTTLIMGTTENLTSYAKNLGKTLPGKIIAIESLEPFNNTNPDRDLKYAGDTGIICCQDGQPIYRKTEYTYDVEAQDILIEHTNGDAIRAANESSFELDKSKIKNATTAEAFGLKSDDTTTDETEDVTDMEVTEEEVVAEVETEEEEVLEEETETFEL
jgi:hypothetical protein